MVVKTKALKEKEAKHSKAMAELSEEKDEMRWKAESDARTLMEADRIKGDKARFAKAKSVAKEQAEAFIRITK